MLICRSVGLCIQIMRKQKSLALKNYNGGPHVSSEFIPGSPKSFVGNMQHTGWE